MPFVRPATTQESEPVVAQVLPVRRGCDRVRGDRVPPVSAGALQETVADAFAPTALTAVGAPGTVAGVTAAEAAEAGPGPFPFVARTVNVYGVPFARPLTVQPSAPVVPHVAPPGAALTS